jgi:hypothetical protein
MRSNPNTRQQLGDLKEADPYPPKHRGASFYTYHRETAIIGQDQGSALAVVPGGPCQRLRGLPPHKYIGVQRCNQTVTKAAHEFWCIWFGNFDPHEPTQVSPLTNRVSHRARTEPGEWFGAFGAFGTVILALTSPRKHFTRQVDSTVS